MDIYSKNFFKSWIKLVCVLSAHYLILLHNKNLLSNRMYSWVSTEFSRHEIPSLRNSVDAEFCRYGNPSIHGHGIPLTQNSVDMEFPLCHGIPSWTRNSPVDTEFPRGHRILSTRNSVDTEFCRHGIRSTRNFADMEFRPHGIPSARNSVSTEFCRHGILHIFFTSVYLVCYALLFIFGPYMEFRGIRGISQI
jgi:hypothetical protein